MAKHRNYWAVVPAAGTGSRMHSSTPKQYLKINDKTVIEHTLSVLLACPDLKRIVVCVSSHDDCWPQLEISQHARIVTVHGGASRADSVLNGLQELHSSADDDDWVLVHDAARPCLTGELLAQLMASLHEHPVGGILAVPAKDTLKQSAGETNSDIETTLDRSRVWLAQTPQMFRYRLIVNCLKRALESKVAVTDEASALEWAGYTPRLVQGDSRNLKVTTPEDLTLAEFLLAAGQGGATG